jgi:U4/U6 small nuclear ribonucleoprotein PRP3
MNPKRPLDESSDGSQKRAKVESMEDKRRRARELVTQLKAGKERTKQQTQKEEEPQKKEPERSIVQGRGLNIELHPLLTGEQEWKTENPNLQKFKKRGYLVNPYLSDSKPERRKREFKFNAQGKYIAEGDELRKQRAIVETEKAVEELKRQQGLLPDLTVQEDKYEVTAQPQCEWWDLPFFHDSDYYKLNMESISNYIQHPVPIMAPWERHLPPPKPLFLTKKETKRIRRQTRAEKYEEEQNKIRLGLAPKPAPKVKLNNLMSVLTTQAIKDPTAVEQQVRREVEERKKQHIADNESRKLTKEQRVQKLEQKVERDLQRGYYSAVFLVDKLEHPSHKFKVERNATQSRFVGTVLHSPRFALVIVEGTEKNIRHYKKLMLNRINWDESTTVEGKELDLSDNKCELIWEGQLKELHFKKWSVYRADSDQVAMDYLSHFRLSNYYKEASVRRAMS